MVNELLGDTLICHNNMVHHDRWYNDTKLAQICSIIATNKKCHESLCEEGREGLLGFQSEELPMSLAEELPMSLAL